jgi:thiamine transport system ATP-binding protein
VAGAGLDVVGVSVRYGTTTAVDNVTFAVEPAEIVAVIGPSGCGKSTLLRAVAGLEPLHDGAICWAGDDLRDVPPHERGTGLMFQDHALFPHRDVAANVAFGLKMQHRPKAEQQARVDELLELVGLAGFGPRRIDELSGGEAQRVALARSLAPRPRLVMLDEPLGSLDRALRDRLATDIRTTLRAMGIAALHVTHDQDEAFTVADRVAVMDAGRLVQIATPATLWAAPATRFVATFLGHHVVDPDEAARLGVSAASAGGPAAVVLLPGALVADPTGAVEGIVRDVRFTSLAVRVDVVIDGLHDPLPVVVAHGAPDAPRLRDARPGDHLCLRVLPSRTVAVGAGSHP